MTKFLNISTDNTLGGNSPSNELVASQKAIKEYVDNNSGSIATGITNKNTATGATNPIYDWVGTLAEYNAQDIENQHPDWICYITDDVSGGASVYTKAEVDNIFAVLYPVGSLYLGTQATCPLTTIIPGSEWTLVATKIVVNNPNNIPVLGNGMTLGLQNSTYSLGLEYANGFRVAVGAYGKPKGSANAAETNPGAATLGVSTDATKSGLKADMSSVATITTNVWRRTA